MSAIDCNPTVQRKKLSSLNRFFTLWIFLASVPAMSLLRGFVQGEGHGVVNNTPCPLFLFSQFLHCLLRETRLGHETIAVVCQTCLFCVDLCKVKDTALLITRRVPSFCFLNFCTACCGRHGWDTKAL